jgi:hypothetical protein
MTLFNQISLKFNKIVDKSLKFNYIYNMPIDIKENTIRARVRNPGEFQPGSFRTIVLSEEQGISQVIGRLKGETNTTGQSIIFDKRKKNWTQEMVEKWLKEHGLEVT